MIVVGITGASGVIYGIRLLEVLKELNIESGLVISDAGKTVIESETDYSIKDVINLSDNYYDFNDLTSSVNSGSFKFEGLAIVPCSMKTLSSIANEITSCSSSSKLLLYSFILKSPNIFFIVFSFSPADALSMHIIINKKIVKKYFNIFIHNHLKHITNF